MNKPSYSLINAEKQHEAAPKTYQIPLLKLRQNVPLGDFVKLTFVDPDPRKNGERMWVKVTEKREDGSYSGVLDNSPHIVSAVCGEEVIFKPEHIAGYLKAESAPIMPTELPSNFRWVAPHTNQG